MNGRREGSDKLPNDFPSLTNETTGCAITRAGVFDPGGTRIYEFTEAERQRVEIARRRKNTAVQYSRLHAAQYFRITAHCANYDISRGIEGRRQYRPSPPLEASDSERQRFCLEQTIGIRRTWH